MKVPKGLTSGSRLLIFLLKGEHLCVQTASSQRNSLFDFSSLNVSNQKSSLLSRPSHRLQVLAKAPVAGQHLAVPHLRAVAAQGGRGRLLILLPTGEHPGVPIAMREPLLVFFDFCSLKGFQSFYYFRFFVSSFLLCFFDSSLLCFVSFLLFCILMFHFVLLPSVFSVPPSSCIDHAPSNTFHLEFKYNLVRCIVIICIMVCCLMFGNRVRHTYVNFLNIYIYIYIYMNLFLYRYKHVNVCICASHVC